MWGIFFGEFSIFPLMIVRQLVVIPVLSQEGVSARPSTLPSSRVIILGFPGGAVVKNLPANAGDTG